MRTYPHPFGAAGGFGSWPASPCWSSARARCAAQQRKYLVELGAAGAYQSFDSATDLEGAAGRDRAGWGSGSRSTSRSRSQGPSPRRSTHRPARTRVVNANTFRASVLYNFLIGASNSFYLKAGAGTTKYGSDCPVANPSDPICGSSGSLLAGPGSASGVTPTLWPGPRELYNRNKSKQPRPAGDLTNVGVNLGLSVMLGSKPIPDTDGDGISTTATGAPTPRPAPRWTAAAARATSDGDGVPDGVDRCPRRWPAPPWTPAAAPRTPTATTSPTGWTGAPTPRRACWSIRDGCPKDSDGDGIPDGLDRCSDTPARSHRGRAGLPRRRGRRWGARWPRSLPTDAGRSHGDAQRVRRRARRPASRRPRCHQRRPAPRRQPGGRRAGARDPARAQPPPTATRHHPAARSGAHGRCPDCPGGRRTIAAGRHPRSRLRSRDGPAAPSAYVALDSVAAILLRRPAGHRRGLGPHGQRGSPAENLRLTGLQAEAVRDYLVVKGVPLPADRRAGLRATLPRTPDTTPRGRAVNRRVEIRPVTPGP